MTTKTTYRARMGDIERRWQVLDAAGRPLGRVASEAAALLLGKHRPDYEPHLAMGDHVVIVNAEQIALTGNKASQKVYYRHSGYPGALRSRSFAEQMRRDPTKVLERAIRGMLPHNSRGRELFRHLRVYAGPEHPHEAQVNAGTGARAKQRAARGERDMSTAAAVSTDEAVETTAAPAEALGETTTAAAASDERLSGSLGRYKRAELDAEAERLGIEIDADWNKDDVAAAIDAHYEEHPLQESE